MLAREDTFDVCRVMPGINNILKSGKIEFNKDI